MCSGTARMYLGLGRLGQKGQNLIKGIEMKGISPILVIDVFGFVVLISFWDQMSKFKITAGKQCEYDIFISV